MQQFSPVCYRFVCIELVCYKFGTVNISSKFSTWRLAFYLHITKSKELKIRTKKPRKQRTCRRKNSKSIHVTTKNYKTIKKKYISCYNELSTTVPQPLTAHSSSFKYTFIVLLSGVRPLAAVATTQMRLSGTKSAPAQPGTHTYEALCKASLCKMGSMLFRGRKMIIK